MPDSEPSPPFSAQDLASGLLRLVQHYQRVGIAYFPRGDAEAGRTALSALETAESTDRSAVTEISEPPAPATAASANASVPSAVAPSRPVASPASAPRPTVPAASPSGGMSLAQRQHQLQQLAERVAGCTRCQLLATTRTQTVFGEGNPAARVVFFGEAPGADEDRQGRPFVGKAGQLLTKMIEACSMCREDVYILNTLKCRPPGNRNPEPAEVVHCCEYYQAQLEIVRPEYIVCLGLIAAQSLLDSKLSVGRLRGRFHDYRNSKVLVTYHPAYLLRNPSAKRAAWDDLKLMLRDMGVQPSSR